jgi:hypothetical protein
MATCLSIRRLGVPLSGEKETTPAHRDQGKKELTMCSTTVLLGHLPQYYCIKQRTRHHINIDEKDREGIQGQVPETDLQLTQQDWKENLKESTHS